MRFKIIFGLMAILAAVSCKSGEETIPPDTGKNFSISVSTPILVWNGASTSVQLIATGTDNQTVIWSSPAAINPARATASAIIAGNGRSVTATLPTFGVYQFRATLSDGRVANTWVQAWDNRHALSSGGIGTRPATTPPTSVRQLSSLPTAFSHPRVLVTDDDWADISSRSQTGKISGWGLRTLQTQVNASIGTPSSQIGQLFTALDTWGTSGGTAPDVSLLASDSVLASEASNSFWGMLLGSSTLFWIQHQPNMPLTAPDQDQVAKLARVLAAVCKLYLQTNWDAASKSIINTTSVLKIGGLANIGQQTTAVGISEIALAYDFLYDWMNETQRSAVRDLLYVVSWGRHQAPAGFDNAGKVRLGSSMNGDFSNLNDHMLLAGFAIEGEESKVNPDLVAKFGSAKGTVADAWVKLANPTDVAAWSGATQGAIDGLERQIRWIQDWFITPWGLAASHLAYFGLTAKHMLPTTLAYARRSENLFVTSNLYQLSLHALQALHPAESPIVSRQGLGSTPLGWWDHHDSGSFEQRGTAPTLLKYMYPDDPLVDYVWQAYIPTLDRDPLIVLLFGIDPNTTANLSDVANAKQLPNVIFDPQRGFATLRSGWTDNDISLWFESNGSDPYAGHMHAERNSFDFFALGRAWSVAPGYHCTVSDLQAGVLVKDPTLVSDPATGGYIGQSPSSSTNRAGFKGHFPTPPGKILEMTETPSYALVAGDATTAYTFGYEQGMPRNLDTGKARSEFLYPGVLDVFLKRSPLYADLFAQTLKVSAQYNPMNHAIRSVLLVRGAKPYVLVVDDINKNNAAQDWQWTMNSGFCWFPEKDTRFIKANGSPAYSSTALEAGATASDAVLWHSPIDDGAGKARLLVRDLGVNATVNQPNIRLESRPPNQPNIPYLTYGIDNNNPSGGYTKVPSNRLLIERKNVTTPDYTVLLYPYKSGEALPTTTWNADRSVLTIALPGGITHTIQFDRTQPDKRTRLRLQTP